MQPLEMTAEEYRVLYGEPSVRRNKFNARKTTVGDITFDSAAEARRYMVLKSEADAGGIGLLLLQPHFLLLSAFTDHQGRKHRRVEYVADFQYVVWKEKEGWMTIVEDVKSPATRTPLFRLKWKMVIRQHPDIEFREVQET